MPAILLMSKATQSNGSSKFGGFVGYIGREDAFKLKELTTQEVKNIILNDGEKNNYAFRNYIFYEKNPLKANGLFDKNNDYMRGFQQRNLVKKVNQAEKNGSPLFQDVISFDNKFLEENHIYNSQTGYLNEAKIKQSIRKGMDNMLRSEGFRLDNNTIWAAAIHRNTDNIHVHIATTELETTRPKIMIKGKDDIPDHEEYKVKRKFNNLNRMKHIVVQNVMDSKNLERHNEILNSLDKQSKDMREQLVSNISKDVASIRSIVKALPNSRKLWRFNSNSKLMKPANEKTAKYINNQLNGELAPHFTVFSRLVDNQNQMYVDLYGKADRNQEVKFDRLKEQMANGIYKEIKKEFDDIEKNENSIYDKNFDPETLDKIKRKTSFEIDKERKKFNEDKIADLSKQLEEMSKSQQANSKEFILTKERLDHFKAMNGSFKNTDPETRLDMYKNKMDFNFSKLKLKDDVKFIENGVINYNALKSQSAKQIEYANGFATYNNLYHKQKTLNSLFKVNDELKTSLQKNLNKIRDPKTKGGKKASAIAKMNKSHDLRTLNLKKIAHTFEDADKVGMINHSKYRAASYPSYRQVFTEQARNLEAERDSSNKQFNKEMQKLQKQLGKSEKMYKSSTKSKLLRSPKRLRKLGNSIREASLNNLVHMNQVERQEHRIKAKEYEKEMEIKRSVYYENKGREL